ncbi:MAG: hypothetical protein ACD_3C00054G0028 [uncultured bacterium (gcode 4)]|uniref:Aminoglycoside phosphotransferase domain-containing protein n=1 Tax=uncultured bacterium (gcode 4) TaxID=1234023 RepID=K2FZV6_9BACT|nr:MAG: hypothetical protein ACD_3C00054G0028 [uncultured bacterium (gcode 4)]
MDKKTLQIYLSEKYPDIFSDADLQEIHESSNNEVFSYWDFILKVSEDKDNLRKEFEFLKLLENRWKFPKAISYDIENGRHILVISKLDWVWLQHVWGKLGENEKNIILKDIIFQLKIIHSTIGEGFIWSDFGKTNGSEKAFSKAILNPHIPKDEVEFARSEISRYEKTFDSSVFWLVHNDLWYRNILVADWKISWIIDFELSFMWPIVSDYFKILHHRISALNYEDKTPIHYEELDFLDSLIDIIKSDYPKLVDQATAEKFYSYNLNAYLSKLSRFEEPWYDHAEVLSFKDSYCNLDKLFSELPWWN